jgi:hypothetical protein
MLGFLLHAPRGPFYSRRQLGAVGGQLGRPILPSVEWCTGQSGAPPDSHCSSPVRDLLPYLAHPTVGPRDRLAHRTVRCAQPTVGTGHVSRVDRAADRWLTGQSGAPPDSPMNYSHVASLFPRAASWRLTSLGHRTLSSAPQDSPVHEARDVVGCWQPTFFQFKSSCLGTVSST